MAEQIKNNIKSINIDPSRSEKDLENLFEAEAEYVLDRLQQQAHQVFGEGAGSVSDCMGDINRRLAGIASQSRQCGRRYWLRDMGIIVLQIMTLMEAHGYQLSEEVLEVLAQARIDYRAAAACSKEREQLAG